MRKLIEFITGVGAALAICVLIFESAQLKDDYINSKRPSVVMLTNLIQTSGGTGFFVRTPSGKLKILTNGHVCRLAGPDKGLMVIGENDVGVAYVEAVYENNDLCLLDTPIEAPALKIASSVRNTENVYVLGHPLLEPKTLVSGQISGSRTVQVMQGYDVPNCTGPTYHQVPPDFIGFLVGAKYACIRETEATIATTNILPGNSGSPVLNAYGNVVGVAFAGAPGTVRAMIVPLDDVQDFLKDK